MQTRGLVTRILMTIEYTVRVPHLKLKSKQQLLIMLLANGIQKQLC
jgi:hypothetical protein